MREQLELSLYSPRKKIQRFIVSLSMIIILIYSCIQLSSKDIMSTSAINSAINIALYALIRFILPVAIIIGIQKQKPYGINGVFLLIFISTLSIEFSFIMLGPCFFNTHEWRNILFLLFMIILIGPRELWESNWAGFDPIKSITPLWLDKATLIGSLVLIQFAFIGVFVYSTRDSNFLYPTPVYKQLTQPNHNITFIWPFQFQVQLPPEAKLIHVNSNDRELTLKVGKLILSLKSENELQAILPFRYQNRKSIDALMAERFGLFPKIVKTRILGENPNRFEKLVGKDIWGYFAVESLKTTTGTFVEAPIYLWDDHEIPIGSITSMFSGPTTQNWDWVYTIQKSNVDPWPEGKYIQSSQEYDHVGNTQMAEISLAASVLVSKNKAQSFTKLIKFMQKHESPGRIKFQLNYAIEQYPNDPTLKAIKVEVLAKYPDKKKGPLTNHAAVGAK